MSTPTIARNIDGTIGFMTVGMIKIIGIITIIDNYSVQSLDRPEFHPATSSLIWGSPLFFTRFDWASPPFPPIFNGAEISKKCVDLTVELVKHISRLLQRVESARIIAQNFLFDGGR